MHLTLLGYFAVWFVCVPLALTRKQTEGCYKFFLIYHFKMLFITFFKPSFKKELHKFIIKNLTVKVHI